jgi:hypothetical protein
MWHGPNAPAGGVVDEPGGVALDDSGRVTGFALLRRFGRGHVIGPVAAPNVDCAKAMIAPLLDRYAGQFMRIDIPKESGLSAWLVAAELAEAGAVIRMVRGNDAAGECEVHTFGLASQAFG